MTQTGASRRTQIDTVGSSSIESSSHLSLTKEGTTSGTYELTEAVLLQKQARCERSSTLTRSKLRQSASAPRQRAACVNPCLLVLKPALARCQIGRRERRRWVSGDPSARRYAADLAATESSAIRCVSGRNNVATTVSAQQAATYPATAPTPYFANSTVAMNGATPPDTTDVS